MKTANHSPALSAPSTLSRSLWLVAGTLVVCLVTSGCSRVFYRRQADIEAYALVREKASHPHWSLDNYSISIDPRSRMYDPFCTDCPPLPPDDPTAHALMHCVDNKRGWPFWHDNGDIPYTENPAWPEYIEIDDRGILRISSEDAVRLALLHSRTYQAQLEQLYLSALDVSFQRFRFDAQFFGGYEAFFTHTGRARSGLAQQTGVGGESSSIFELNTRNWSVQKLFPTGAELVVGFANSLVWQFSGPDDYTGTTLIDFALLQPLLRNAGRDRVLESLTVAERTLLADVRAMEQYRSAFYLEVMTGAGATGGPGATPAGGAIQLPAGVNAGAGSAGGFMGLLQAKREIRNQEDNVQRLRRNVTRLTFQLVEQPSERTGTYLNQGLQVAQARQSLLRAESALLNARNNFEAQLDTFKINLGLPPQICVEPVDPMLDQFELIDQDIIQLPEDFERIMIDHAAVRQEISDRIQSHVREVPEGSGNCVLEAYEELQSDLGRIEPALAEIQAFVERIVEVHIPTVERDLQRFQESLPRRRAWLERVMQRIEEARQGGPCELLPLSVNPLATIGAQDETRALLERLDRALGESQRSYEILSGNFKRYAESLALRRENAARVRQNGNLTPEQRFELLVRGVFNPNYRCGQTRILSIDVVEDVNRELIELQLLQAVARAESIELQDIDLRADQALEVARKYRRDWMNARASLVDAWRLIQFESDQLQSDLSVLFSGDIGNITDNPFRLRADTGSLRVGVQFDAPLTRLVERNNYRVALINYQQARRDYYEFEDRVAQALRRILRTVTANQINFELQRLAVLEAARQVMLNTFIDQEEQRALTVREGSRVTAARDAVSALTDLLDAQNAFMGIWVNYEVLRRSLDFNLGTMQLDSEGLWIDPGRIGQDYGQYDPWLRTNLWNDGAVTTPEGETLPGVPPTKGKLNVDELPIPHFDLPAESGPQSIDIFEPPPVPPVRVR